MNVHGKKIFISPLDWGLGHTTRCIPIIKALQALGAQIWIGVNQEQQALLENELTNVNYIYLKGYNVNYPSSSNMAIKMALQLPKILYRIKKEKLALKKLISIHNFDLIISDNRFGLYAEDVPSIYITHQIYIQAPIGIDLILLDLNKKYISNFTQCWIPDYNNIEQSLAGLLSKTATEENYFFIGPISRFDTPSTSTKSEYHYTALISGPEPQRSIFEKQVIQLFETKKEKCAIIGGKPLENNIHHRNNIDYFPHLSSQQLYELVTVSEQIICRPGYSSIMDLSVLQKPVFFIPTPGQTEQEYLARYYFKKYGIGYCSQKKMLLKRTAYNFNLLPFNPNLKLKEILAENLAQLN